MANMRFYTSSGKPKAQHQQSLRQSIPVPIIWETHYSGVFVLVGVTNRLSRVTGQNRAENTLDSKRWIRMEGFLRQSTPPAGGVPYSPQTTLRAGRVTCIPQTMLPEGGVAYIPA